MGNLVERDPQIGWNDLAIWGNYLGMYPIVFAAFFRRKADTSDQGHGVLCCGELFAGDNVKSATDDGEQAIVLEGRSIGEKREFKIHEARPSVLLAIIADFEGGYFITTIGLY